MSIDEVGGRIGRGVSRHEEAQHGGRRIGSQGCAVPPICFANRLPHAPLRGAFGVPDTRSGARAPGTVFNPEDRTPGARIMASFDHHFDCRSDIIIDGLKAEFGAIVADRIIEAEAADFLWEARVLERYLGQEADVFDRDGEELSRVLVLSRLNEKWWIALCLIDGEGEVVELCWRQPFADCGTAVAAWPSGH
ncbi:hypothetical protein ABDK56_09695 [Sphingomonas sp. ASV193]|uniref:hypothetical protein n=1 Tax=Sphingomonas sp. ASV193 TaxID=3144405 RepID=UPI0032E87118